MTSILGTPVVASSYADVVTKSLDWASRRESRILVFANVHVVMEAVDDPSYLHCLKRADMVNPDGVPSRLGSQAPWVIAMHRVSTDRTLRWRWSRPPRKMVFRLASTEAPPKYSTICSRFSGSASLPSMWFTPSLLPSEQLSDDENEQVIRDITESGARILFIGLGCPKQERWMVKNAGRIPAVMFGVGAAFDFIAGTKKQAPRWMMKSGLEWLFRLGSEPRRLAQRYFKHNPRFIVMLARQLMSGGGGRTV